MKNKEYTVKLRLDLDLLRQQKRILIDRANYYSKLGKLELHSKEMMRVYNRLVCMIDTMQDYIADTKEDTKDDVFPAEEIIQSKMEEYFNRPRQTFWSPMGYMNTFYTDTQTWDRPPTKALMKNVRDTKGKLDNEE